MSAEQIGAHQLESGGRKLLRLEVRNAETPIERKPEWIKTRAKMGPEYTALHGLVKEEGLHTVCQEAGCPNIYECWEDREATFLIGGSQCTRRCDFCQIDTGKPADYDRDEPRRVAESVVKMGLRYATVTGVARDDLPDEGAWLHAETVRAIHAANPGTGVEILATDFSGNPTLLEEVFSSRPEVFAHNVETVPRIFKRIRPAFRYDRSLDVLTQARAYGLITKSNLILGMGETREEVSQALQDLHDAGTDIITITQYLRPTPRHLPVDRWVRPEEFVEMKAEAEAIGFLGVLAGPLVRSSYRAGRLWARSMMAKGRDIPSHLTHLGATPKLGFAQGRIVGAMARPTAPEKEPGRLKQMWQVFQMTRRYDGTVVLYLLLAFLAPTGAGIVLAILFGAGNPVPMILYIVAGVLAGVLLTLIVLGRRAEKAAFSQIEGQPGAVGAVLKSSLRRSWTRQRDPDQLQQDAGCRLPRGRQGRCRALRRRSAVAHAADARQGARQRAPHPARGSRASDLRRSRSRLDAAAQDRRLAREVQAGTDEERDPAGVQPSAVARQERPADPEGDRPQPGSGTATPLDPARPAPRGCPPHGREGRAGRHP